MAEPRLQPNTVDVRDYGALFDGVTDDTEAIQRAMDAAGSDGMVLFPAGIALITGMLVPPAGQQVERLSLTYEPAASPR